MQNAVTAVWVGLGFMLGILLVVIFRMGRWILW